MAKVAFECIRMNNQWNNRNAEIITDTEIIKKEIEDLNSVRILLKLSQSHQTCFDDNFHAFRRKLETPKLSIETE